MHVCTAGAHALTHFVVRGGRGDTKVGEHREAIITFFLLILFRFRLRSNGHFTSKLLLLTTKLHERNKRRVN